MLFMSLLICPVLFHFLNLNFQFPIGIDSDRFIRALKIPEVQEHIEELKERFKGRKVYDCLSPQCCCYLSCKNITTVYFSALMCLA